MLRHRRPPLGGLGLPPGDTAAVRRTEMEASAALLGVELDWLGLPEGGWRPEELEGRLLRSVERWRPGVVYAPSRIDFHPEHEKVARALAAALGDASSGARAPAIRIYAVQVPLTPGLTNLLVPVDLAEPRLREAFQTHRSQIGSLERCLRHRRYTACRHGLAGGAEELWQVTAMQYGWLHREPPERPLHRTFRGLRYYAWSDPLAYLAGGAERRRLARLAAEEG